jgi:hypothetical protein
MHFGVKEVKIFLEVTEGSQRDIPKFILGLRRLKSS